MATGFFLGIRESYTEEAQNIAENFLLEINYSLKNVGIEKYFEPRLIPDVYNNDFFGESALDHHNSEVLRELGELISSKINKPHGILIKLNPYRVAFLPIDFKRPLTTNHIEQFFGDQNVAINVGSSIRFFQELLEIAVYLNIKIDDGKITQEQINLINELIPFEKDDERKEQILNLRSAWLLCFEGAKLSIENNIALSLAG